MQLNFKHRPINGSKPAVILVSNHFLYYPTPSSLNYNWSFGSLAGLFFALQIVTGIFLAMHYTPHVEWAFASVEHIMTDVSGGYLFRYFHANGASMIFILIYLHIGRNLYYQSYITRPVLWNTGVVIFLLMMATAFIGYVLPWGQMSFWGATVITSLVTAVPFVGEAIAHWVWGGFSISNATLVRFYALHFTLPFIVLGVIAGHLVALHTSGSSDPLVLPLTPSKVTFHPYYTAKDAFIFLVVFAFFARLVCFAPNLLGHSDNFLPANPLVTPAHIVPEWYFTPFYAILRACPNKLGGAIGMFAAILLLFAIPALISSASPDALIVAATYSTAHKVGAWFFAGIFLTLMYLGMRAAEAPYVFASKIFTALYFSYFLIFLPTLSWLTRQILQSREVLAHSVLGFACAILRVLMPKSTNTTSNKKYIEKTANQQSARKRPTAKTSGPHLQQQSTVSSLKNVTRKKKNIKHSHKGSTPQPVSPRLPVVAQKASKTRKSSDRGRSIPPTKSALYARRRLAKRFLLGQSVVTAPRKTNIRSVDSTRVYVVSSTKLLPRTVRPWRTTRLRRSRWRRLLRRFNGRKSIHRPARSFTLHPRIHRLRGARALRRKLLTVRRKKLVALVRVFRQLPCKQSSRFAVLACRPVLRCKGPRRQRRLARLYRNVEVLQRVRTKIFARIPRALHQLRAFRATTYSWKRAYTASRAFLYFAYMYWKKRAPYSHAIAPRIRHALSLVPKALRPSVRPRTSAYYLAAGGGRNYVLACGVVARNGRVLRHKRVSSQRALRASARLASTQASNLRFAGCVMLPRKYRLARAGAHRRFRRAALRFPLQLAFAARAYSPVSVQRMRFIYKCRRAVAKYHHALVTMRQPQLAPILIAKTIRPFSLVRRRRSFGVRAGGILKALHVGANYKRQNRPSTTQQHVALLKRRAVLVFKERAYVRGLAQQQFARVLASAERPLTLRSSSHKRSHFGWAVPAEFRKLRARPLTFYRLRKVGDAVGPVASVRASRQRRYWPAYKYSYAAKPFRRFLQVNVRTIRLRRAFRRARWLNLRKRRPRIRYIRYVTRNFRATRRRKCRALRQRLRRKSVRRDYNKTVRALLKRASQLRFGAIQRLRRRANYFLRRHLSPRAPRSAWQRGARRYFVDGCYIAVKRYGLHHISTNKGRLQFLWPASATALGNSFSKLLHLTPQLARRWLRGISIGSRFRRAHYLRSYSRSSRQSHRLARGTRTPLHNTDATVAFTALRRPAFKSALTSHRNQALSLLHMPFSSITHVRPRPGLRYFITPRLGGIGLQFGPFTRLLRRNKYKKVKKDQQIYGRVIVRAARPRYISSVLRPPLKFWRNRSRSRRRISSRWRAAVRRSLIELLPLRLLRLRRAYRIRRFRRVFSGRIAKRRRLLWSTRRRRKKACVKRRLKLRRKRRRWWRTILRRGRRLRRRHWYDRRAHKRVFRRRLRLTRAWRSALRPLVRRPACLRRKYRRYRRLRWHASRRPRLDKSRRYSTRHRRRLHRRCRARMLRCRLRRRRSAARLALFSRQRKQLERYCPVRIYRRAPARLSYRPFAVFTRDFGLAASMSHPTIC